MDEERKFRELIIRKMNEIIEELKDFELTTHRHFSIGAAYTDFAEALEVAYREPTSFTISDFKQAAERMWKE